MAGPELRCPVTAGQGDAFCKAISAGLRAFLTSGFPCALLLPAPGQASTTAWLEEDDEGEQALTVLL